jgi:hypothetical protein
MTTLRKWRFPILIGSGLIAAAALVYFSNGHIGADKTQGAIGKRDVYRDGQVNSADVATPGSAPVATQAIFESSEFKALAKNPAFQQTLASEEFTELSHQQAFAGLLANEHFRALAGDEHFARLVNNAIFQKALSESLKGGLNRADIFAALHDKVDFERFANDKHMKALLENPAFAAMIQVQSFNNLLAMQYFQFTMRLNEFALLASHADFQSRLEQGMFANFRVPE